ncbi:unnamed protein product, partial [marine sediment metagenome]
PLQKNIVPIVAINDGTPTFTTSIPFKSPASKPVIKELTTAKVTFPVEVNTARHTHPENPIIEGKERSISLQIITGVQAIAMIAIKGMVDIKEENFEVGYNEVVGLIGDNGAGKSTLIKILTGVHTPDKGRIYFKGEEISFLPAANGNSITLSINA